MPLEKFTELCIPYFVKQGLIKPIFGDQSPIMPNVYTTNFGINGFETCEGEKINFAFLENVIKLYQERLKKLSEIGDIADYFFIEPKCDIKLLQWKNMTNQELTQSLNNSIKILSKIKDRNWTLKNITNKLIAEANKIEKEKGGRGALLWPLRVALSNKKASASPFDILCVLGPKKALKRLKMALKCVKNAK